MMKLVTEDSETGGAKALAKMPPTLAVLKVPLGVRVKSAVLNTPEPFTSFP